MTDFGQRHAVLLPPLPRLRLALAALTLGVALAGAAILHGHRAPHTYSCPATVTVPHSCLYVVRLERPGWVDPVALGICLLGLAAAVGIIVSLRLFLRFTAAALMIGAAVAAAVALSGHRVVGAEHSCPRTAGYECVYHPRPAWVVPGVAGLVVLGSAGAAGILVATRRRS